MEDNHKPWVREDSDESKVRETVSQERKPRYEVVKGFSVGSRKIKPGDPFPSKVSAEALASLLRKGVVVDTLEE